MGPGIFHPGYFVWKVPNGGLVFPLQWGRGYSTPDTRTSRRSAATATRLQWGRGYSTPDTARLHDPLGGAAVASMGPGIFHPGYHRTRAGEHSGHDLASMGPGIFHPGYPAGPDGGPPLVWTLLQWGRGYSTPDTRRVPPLICPTFFGFNGAGDIPPRIPLERGVAEPDGEGASMGPGIFHPGYPKRCHMTQPDAAPASMGPGIFHPGYRAEITTNREWAR